MFESTYTLYIEDDPIAASPSLEQMKVLAAPHLQDRKRPRIRLPGGGFLLYDSERQEWMPAYLAE
jgi:hypothetical protein